MRSLVFAVLLGSRPPLVVKRPDPIPVVHTAGRTSCSRSERLLRAIEMSSVLARPQRERGAGSKWETDRPVTRTAASTQYAYAIVFEIV